MLALIDLLKGRILQLLLIAFLGLSVAACGGSSGGSAPPPNTGGDDNGDDDDDDDNDDDDDDDGDGGEKPTASISPDDGTLSAREPIVIVFSTAMDTESVELGGALAADASAAWSDDTTLTLTPTGYWNPGSNDITINASSAGGTTMDTASASFDVSAPFATFQNASLVIGQADFESNLSRQLGDAATSAQANTLDGPMGAVAYASEENILFVNDSHDARVLGFDGIPDMSNPSASLVVGQPGFTNSAGAVQADRLMQPQSVSTEGGKLVVTDAFGNRVLIYDSVPISGPVSASVVVGQDAMTSSESGCAPNRLHQNHIHGHFVSTDGKLIVADSGNNRVLIWNTLPTQNGQAPDLVLGQAAFDTCAPNDDDQNGAEDVGSIPSARTLKHPTNVWTDGNRLFVADQENNRVLIWNEFPTENFAPADVVLGQETMSANVINDDNQDGADDGVATARTMHFPWDVRVAHGQLFVTDMENNRVLIWNEVPTTSFAPADVVIGQADFAGVAENAGGAVAANTLNRPAGVQIVNGNMFITDWENHRVLMFEPQ